MNVPDRKKKMREELEKRLETTAEREALARDLIRQELVEMATAGSAEGLKAKLEELADLHAKGVLSDEEFAAAKAKALGI